jgi:hypothetical protein
VITGHILSALFITCLGVAAVAVPAAAAVLAVGGGAWPARRVGRGRFPARSQATGAAR